MVSGVWSNDNNLQLEATTQFRKLLSIGIAKEIIWDLQVPVMFYYAMINGYCAFLKFDQQSEAHP